MTWPAYHDLIAGAVTLLTVGAIVILTILNRPISEPLLGIASLSTGWLFGRGVQLPIYARVNGMGAQIVTSNQTVTAVPPAPTNESKAA